jgi:hypothetical protein
MKIAEKTMTAELEDELDSIDQEDIVLQTKIDDVKNESFCMKRPEMPQFSYPLNVYKDHFAWFSDWGLELPEGYSALFMNPMNRFDLPFINTTGIVDSDKVHLLGTFPFFILKDWEGTIPAGTPYMQILPFKREDWDHEISIVDPQKMYNLHMENMKFYRKPDGGVYKNEVWSRREYK